MRKEDVLFLNQLVQSLEEAGRKLEKSYERKDYTKFNNIKRIMIKIQNEISGVVR